MSVELKYKADVIHIFGTFKKYLKKPFNRIITWLSAYNEIQLS